MKELVVTFGNKSQLTGILSYAHNRSNSDNFSVLLLNAGLLHRVGFNRFNTDLARNIQLKGISSLRFDMLGIGDSADYNSPLPYDSQAILDINCAIDYLLTKTGTDSCVLIGLCSGADYSHHITVGDNCNRISGAAFLDGFAYRTIGFYFHDYFPGILNPYKVTNFLLKKLSKKLLPSKNSDIMHSGSIYTRSFPPKKQVINEMQIIIDKGINLFYIFSGGIPLYYNYRNQFRDMYKKVNFKKNVKFAYFKEANHTYTCIEIREKLIETIINWLVSLNKHH